MYWLGIDGGGTKTEFLLADENGNILARERIGSISYKQVGIECCVLMLKNTVERLREKTTQSDKADIFTCCALPNFGESIESDGLLKEKIEKEMGNYHMYLVNDCEVGWAGSLGLEPGINLVAGTGAIAYGMDERGNSARAGGWNDDFSDEGSCAWLGRKTIELFSRESDGRDESGALLSVVRNYFGLENDFEIIDIYERKYQNNRTQRADLQRLLLQAARRGDKRAARLYRKAAGELAEIVLAVYYKLNFTGNSDVMVSYSGGLFHAGTYIMEPLIRLLEPYPIRVMEPLFSPVHGAVLEAALHWGGKDVAERLKQRWIKS